MRAHYLMFLMLLSSVAVAQTGDQRARGMFFEQHVRPLLAQHCVTCHGEQKQESGLRLDSRAAMLKGGDSGPALVPLKPDESLIVEAIAYDGLEMPPTGKLPAKALVAVRRWIADGAVWPDGSAIRETGRTITDKDRNWWAFRPLNTPTVPSVVPSRWSENEIDAFVFATLDAKDMRPAPQADKRTLVRRAYFDVLGLPPTPDQIEAFANDDAPNAWEKLIDRLLESPHYGEHWARHWLDVVRYAESDGWNQDAYRPRIWRYRDYVVNAFNSDKPWPKFVRQQLAGDEIRNDNPDNLAATGFLRLGIYEYNQRDARGQWNDIMNEMTDVVADTFLGVSMACARCHDHKFDPLLQRDYFALRAFFEPIEWRDDLNYATDRQREEYAKKLVTWEEKTADVRAKIDALLKPYHDKKWKSTVDKFPLDIQACFDKPVTERTSWEHQMAYLVARQFEEEGGGPLKSMKKADKAEHERLKKELAKFNSIKPKAPPTLMAASDFAGEPSATVIQATDEVVEPAFLTVLNSPRRAVGVSPPVRTEQLNDRRRRTEGLTPTARQSRTGRRQTSNAPNSKGTSSEARYETTGRRSALAKWITKPTNPLTNRVIVNRIWQYHFGRGLADSPNDFGEQGQRPTHPELLDWLTTRFIKDGSSFKTLHKRILMSATWQQSATHPNADRYARLDPNEELLWRAQVRRLDAEQIRDAMLVASGELSRKVGGASVDLGKPRRSLYVKSLRNKPDKFLHQFDMANGLKSVAVRNSTTTPTQALLMINGSYPLGRAKVFAKRVKSMKMETVEDVVSFVFRSTTGGDADDTEKQRTADYLRVSLSDAAKSIEEGRLTDFCHVMFNSNEFLYVD